MLSNQVYKAPLAIALGINEIYLQDASTLQLPKEARFIFKGVNTDKDNGAAKLHLTYNLLASQVACFEVSSGVDNNSNYFVSVERYRGNLIIADLGYYCFERFKEIDTAEGFFLSRLKTNLKALVVATSTPEEGNNVGRLLSKTKWKSDIVDMVCQFGKHEESITFRVVGFWNEQEDKYHFYVTNLSTKAELIWNLYRARWQIELAFKAMKQSLMPDRITSAVPAIIRNLILLFVVRFFTTLTLTDFLKQSLDKGTPISVQRIAKVARHLAKEVFDALMGVKRNSIEILIKKAMLYKRDFEKRSNPKRNTTIENLEDQLSTA